MKKIIPFLYWGLAGGPLFAQSSLPLQPQSDSALFKDERLVSVPRGRLAIEIHDYNSYMQAGGATVEPSLLPARLKSFILIHPDYWISLLKFGELVQTGQVSKPKTN